MRNLFILFLFAMVPFASNAEIECKAHCLLVDVKSDGKIQLLGKVDNLKSPQMQAIVQACRGLGGNALVNSYSLRTQGFTVPRPRKDLRPVAPPTLSPGQILVTRHVNATEGNSCKDLSDPEYEVMPIETK